MDFELSEEQEMIREAAREFAQGVVAPTAAARDKDNFFNSASSHTCMTAGV